MLIYLFMFSFSSSHAQFQVEKLKTYDLLNFDEELFDYYPKIRYNRVEGLFLGAGIHYSPLFAPRSMVTAEGGYGFSNEQWRYKFGLSYDFLEFDVLRIGLETYHKTATLDEWYINTIENSLASLIFKEDFMNYFSRKGTRLYVHKVLFENRIQIRAIVDRYSYDNMETKTNWAILGKHKNFKENPDVLEHDENSVQFHFSYDGRDNPVYPLYGFLAEAMFERTTNQFETNGIFLNLRNYFPSIRSHRILTKMVLGARDGSTEEQYTMDMGGLGTLPGYKDKEFTNFNRMLLLNITYNFSGDIMRQIPFSLLPISDALSLSIFSDAGWAYLEKPEEKNLFLAFQKINFNDFRSDFGMTLSFADDIFHLKLAKRLDREKDAWRILCRFMYTY